MNHFFIKNENGEITISNLDNECKKCYKKCESITNLVVCEKYKDKRRFGIFKTNKSSTFLCDNKAKNSKLFRVKLENLSYSYDDIKNVKTTFENSVKINEQKRINRLIHNLTSINAHNIQEVYDIVPQDVLTKNINEQLDFIIKEITENPKNAAMMFIRIAKNNIHMKSEFSIYKKLDRANPTLEKRNHPIHKVFMNVLHTFYADFSDKNVYVNVGTSQSKVTCDYEAIQVALYHIIENSAKYVKPNSTINIDFIDNFEYLDVKMNMSSIHIEQDEIEKIFTEGYSGKEVKRLGKNGEGIGLWRVKQMLELNNASIKINAGKVIEKLMGFKFSENEIIVKFKKH